jgi:hypothetical protein
MEHPRKGARLGVEVADDLVVALDDLVDLQILPPLDAGASQPRGAGSVRRR